MKKKGNILIIIGILILLLCFFTSCKNDDYIEVTAIHVPQSAVYLSPDGVTSSYQLEKPTIIPNNATNTKVIYYVSPEDLQYFSVDEKGLITAKKLTEGKRAFIKIYSSTNEAAYALISVIIENVEVKEIRFKQDQINVQYDSAPFYLDVEFTPYHAQYGRDITYISLDPTVVSVDNTGLVSIKKVGVTTILARAGSTLNSDNIIEGRVQIIVGYAPALYILSVTSQSPQFNQVVGEPQTISFSITRDLHDNIDLNPDIKWYVGGIRERSNDGEWEFDFTPDKNSEPASFFIEARIQPKGESLITLRSPTINLYRNFSDFSLKLNQPNGDKYSFGEPIELIPPEDEDFISDKYDWYIKDKGAEGLGKFLGSSHFSENAGSLIFETEKAGAFVVTALMIKDDIVIDSQEFSFHVMKYMQNERIQVIPQTIVEQRIPDSYDWSVHTYDENTGEIGAKTAVCTTIGNAIFTYDALETGVFVLSCTPSLNNLTVYENNEEGEPVPMRRYTKPFRVWALEGESNIEYISICGTFVNEEYRPVIKWNAIGGVNSFIVEITIGGQVYIVDTVEKDIDEEIIYRDYSIILPSTIASLEQDFSVRIKHKSGAYSKSVQYKGNTIEKRYYYFLKELNYGVNTYIQDMEEMGNLLNYIAIFRPKSLLTDSRENEYKVKIATKLMYRRVDNNKYPVFGENPFDEENLINIYNLVSAAINAYFIKDIQEFDIVYDPLLDGYDIKMKLLSQEYYYQKEEGVNNLDFDINYSAEGKRENAFLINSKDTIEVSTSQQLYHAIIIGKRPLPVKNSIAAQIYQEAKEILTRIINEEFDDYQKVLAIYNFIASEVENDKRLDDYGRGNPLPDNLYLYDGYYLEGVFLHRKAISVGKSKAFSILCWMEGITASVIHGKKGDELYSWNKVRIGDYWYNVDTYSARNQRQYGSAINYNRFLLSDEKMIDYGYSFYAESNLSNQDYDILGSVNGYEFIEDIEQINSLAYYYAEKIEGKDFSFCIKFSEIFEEQHDLREVVLQRINNALAEDLIEVKQILEFLDNSYVIIIGNV